MTPRNSTIKKDRLPLVESKDECNLFTKLLKHCRGESEIQVVEAGGVERFPAMLKNVLLRSRQSNIELQSLGIIRDADKDPERALQSVQSILYGNKLPTPESHAQFTGTHPKVGIFVIPSGTAPGTLETLCRLSVEGDDVAKCVNGYIKCLRGNTEIDGDKTFAHAYLVASPDPRARVGEGALQGLWDFEHEAFRPLVCFLNEMLGRP